MTMPVVQMLYTNVDRVVDGVARSGWQLMTCEPDIDPQLQERLVALMEPELDLVQPLPEFPTPEEQEAADRRLAQVPLPEGLLLMHTAPAGADTTGRANTMTHLVLLADDPDPRLRTADLWRSGGWSTPVGAAQVREARVAGLGELTPGAITEERVDELIAQPGYGAMLAQAADVLEERVRSRAAGRPCSGPTVLVPARSTDEAAVWVAALQRTMAPRTARLLSFTTFSRVMSALDAERVAASPYDLVMVPSSDRIDHAAQREDVVVLTPEQAPSYAPRSGWGRLVAAMTQSVEAWQGARETLEDLVLSFLPQQGGLSPAWPLAMAEAASPGLLSATDPQVADVVDHELVACQPDGLEDASAEYLLSLVSDRILETDESSASYWWSRVCDLPLGDPDAPLGMIAAVLVEKHVSLALRDAQWLVEGQPEPVPGAQAAVRRWFTGAAGAATRQSLAATVRTTLEQTVYWNVPSLLRAAATLARCGVPIDEAAAHGLLREVAAAFVDRSSGELVGCDAPVEVRQAVAGLVNDLLTEPEGPGRPRTVSLPYFSAPESSWLWPGLTADTPELRLMVLASHTQGLGDQESRYWWEAFNALAGAEVRLRYRLDQAVVGRLVAWMLPEHLTAWRPLLADWHTMAAAVAMCQCHTAEGQRLAQECAMVIVSAGGQPLVYDAQGRIEAWQAHTLLAELTWRGLLTMPPQEALNWAVAAVQSWVTVVRGGGTLAQVAYRQPVLGVLYRALVALSAATVVGYQVSPRAVLQVPEGSGLDQAAAVVAEVGAGLKDLIDSEQAQTYLPADVGVGGLMCEAVLCCGEAERRFEGAGERLQAATDLLAGLVADPAKVVLTAVRLRAQALGDHAEAELAQVVGQRSPDDQQVLMDWCRRKVLARSGRRAGWGPLRGR